ncbi:MAG: glycosyltransferase [Candidatus Daviesbacteria bacterium]|nr:glycosyltransferase [Candidatus Daviesbacteria bacterium]
MLKIVSVVLPTYNEKANIEKTVEKVFEQEKNLPGFEINVVIADDIRSSDGTEQIAKELTKKNKRVHFIKVEPGLGVGLIKGHQYALDNLHPSILAQLDADGQVEPDVLVRLVGAIEDGYSLAIGSRFVSGGKNKLSFIRRLFTYGASAFFRIMVGPCDIKEVTNSARALTPALFKKINLEKLPWREQTFIVQPAFLHEAILAGATYKEVPLVFKNRLEGYSKNKVFNYTYDVITYCIDASLNKLGIHVRFFYITRRIKTLVKFSLVGFVGTMVDFLFYKIFINFFLLTPAMSKGFSAEIAIVNNFILNNYWTFRYRKTKTNIWQKFGIFNLVSFGGLLIGVLIVKFLHMTYGDGFVYPFGRHVAYNNFYFFATIPPVMLWNFLINHLVTWRNQED